MSDTSGSVPSPPFRSLSSTLIQSVVAAGVLCTIVVASLQIAFTYQAGRRSFEAEVQSIAEFTVPLLSLSLRDVDPDAVRRQLKLIAARPQIAYVVLESASGQEFYSGEMTRHADEGAITLVIPYPSGQGRDFGTLRLVPNVAYLYRELAKDGLRVLAGFALLTGLICAVVAAILRRQLKLPMEAIAGFASSLKPAGLTRPLELERPRRRWRDEIDEVADGFRMLQDDIRNRVEEIDSVVSKRTVELKRANERLRRLAHRDPLTALPNRRQFDHERFRAWHRMLAAEQPLSVMMIDIDYFKLYNDTYGHAAGDECLKAVAGVLARCFSSPGELPVRMGGEEFAVLLSGVALNAALARAEHVRSEVYALALPHSRSTHERVTVSIGVASASPRDVDIVLAYRAPMTAMADLLGRADEALYDSKAAGRNRVSGFRLTRHRSAILQAS